MSVRAAGVISMHSDVDTYTSKHVNVGVLKCPINNLVEICTIVTISLSFSLPLSPLLFSIQHYHYAYTIHNIHT